MKFETIILSEQKFKELSDFIFKPRSYKRESELKGYVKEINLNQDNIRKKLSEKWQEEEDWEVGYDWNPYMTVYNCGGIYSEKIFCREYVETIMKAISEAKDPSNTYYNTVSEIIVNPNGKTYGEMLEDWGEFYITEGKLYIHEVMSAENIEKLTK